MKIDSHFLSNKLNGKHECYCWCSWLEFVETCCKLFCPYWAQNFPRPWNKLAKNQNNWHFLLELFENVLETFIFSNYYHGEHYGNLKFITIESIRLVSYNWKCCCKIYAFNHQFVLFCFFFLFVCFFFLSPNYNL